MNQRVKFIIEEARKLSREKGLGLFDQLEAAAIYDRDMSAELAGRLIAEFDRVIALLSKRPNAWPPLRGGLRRMLVGAFLYQFIYRVEDGGIGVYAFAHVKRRPRYWVKRVKP